MGRSSIKVVGILSTALVASAAVRTVAGPTSVSFYGVQGHRSAQANFTLSSSNLLVELINTSTADLLVPSDVLTAVFFDLPGWTGLTRSTALIGPTDTVLFGGTDPGGGVGGEWAYRDDIEAGSGAPGGARYGISSTGLGIFGKQNRFPGSNLQGPEAVGGLEYGITSAVDNPATGNTPVTGDNGLIQSSVLFTLTGMPAGADLDQIQNVTFQYGTDLSEPQVPTVPEPAAALLATLGLAVDLRRRRRAGQ